MADYDHNHGSMGDSTDISDVFHRVYADSSFGPTLSCHFSVVVVRGVDDSCWFKVVFLLFHFKSYGVAESEE